MIIGKKLKTLRISKGYEPIEIAERLGISKTTYGRYERNETMPVIARVWEKAAIEKKKRKKYFSI
jgi:transcriptional regulator with XRE-family HTH domain